MEQSLSYAPPQFESCDDTVNQIQRGELIATATSYVDPETGERALMRAVLQDAILCLLGLAADVSARDRPWTVAQARQWFASRDLRWPFSFESICNVLGFEPDSLRRRLLNASARGERVDPEARVTPSNGEMAGVLRTVRLRGNTHKRAIG